MKKTITSYVIAIAAGALSFLTALNIRNVVLLIYRTIKANEIQWEGSFINAVTMIILMVVWIIYLFYTQHYFEKKCSTKQSYINASLKLLLPVVILYLATEIFFRFIFL